MDTKHKILFFRDHKNYGHYTWQGANVWKEVQNANA